MKKSVPITPENVDYDIEPIQNYLLKMYTNTKHGLEEQIAYLIGIKRQTSSSTWAFVPDSSGAIFFKEIEIEIELRNKLIAYVSEVGIEKVNLSKFYFKYDVLTPYDSISKQLTTKFQNSSFEERSIFLQYYISILTIYAESKTYGLPYLGLEIARLASLHKSEIELNKLKQKRLLATKKGSRKKFWRGAIKNLAIECIERASKEGTTEEVQFSKALKEYTVLVEKKNEKGEIIEIEKPINIKSLRNARDNIRAARKQ